MGKFFSLLVLLILITSPLASHPDGATPYWYPSQFIYGFIHTCSPTIENERVPITEKLWPKESQNVWGCVIDVSSHP